VLAVAGRSAEQIEHDPVGWGTPATAFGEARVAKQSKKFLTDKRSAEMIL